MHFVSWFFVFQGFGDSAQGFTNFIIYCIFTDTVRRRMVAVCWGDRGRVSPEPSTRRQETSAWSFCILCLEYEFYPHFILCSALPLIVWDYRAMAVDMFNKRPKAMVITYVYAKNSAPRADRGFLNDVQNTNSNCDIAMWAGIYNFLMHRGVCFDWNYFL